jgi:hypothetical protein
MTTSVTAKIHRNFAQLTLLNHQPLRLVERLHVARLFRNNVDPLARRALAEHQDTHAVTLRILAEDENDDVRISVAENPNVPSAAMLKLAFDPSADVRYALAENARMPAWVLGTLCKDENPYVACRAQSTIDRCTGMRSLAIA